MKKIDIDGRVLLTPRMLSAAMGVCRQTLRNWEKQGVLVPNRVFGKVYYWEDEIAEELERLNANKHKTYHN